MYDINIFQKPKLYEYLVGLLCIAKFLFVAVIPFAIMSGCTQLLTDSFNTVCCEASDTVSLRVEILNTFSYAFWLSWYLSSTYSGYFFIYYWVICFCLIDLWKLIIFSTYPFFTDYMYCKHFLQILQANVLNFSESKSLLLFLMSSAFYILWNKSLPAQEHEDIIL